MHGAGASPPQVIAHAPPSFSNTINPFADQQNPVEEPTNQGAPVFSSLPSNLPSNLGGPLPSNLASNISSLPQVSSSMHSQQNNNAIGKAIYAHG